MQITETKVKVSDLCKNYSDNGDGGVFGFDGKLCIRPEYQRFSCIQISSAMLLSRQCVRAIL